MRPSHVSNMGVFICRTVPQGSPESRRAPLVSSDFGRPGFCLHLVLSFSFQVTFYSVFYEKSDGTSLYPGKIIHAAGQTEPQPSSRVSMKFGRTKMEAKLKKNGG